MENGGLMEDFKQRYIAARRAVIAQDLSRLNPMQRQAAMTTEGPLLLLAGAGSGKTTVLIHRIANLIQYGRGSDTDEVPDTATEADLALLERTDLTPDERRRAQRAAALEPVEPWRIIAITFTNKAADELKDRIERMLGPEAAAFAITCPLITKADGTKFGKTESGNVWLDARYTSPYKFYQFWLNVSDEDAKRYIKIFTLLDRETIEALIAEHEAAPHLRVLQKRLAQEITTMIHSKEEYEKAVEASAILFGGATSEALHRLDEQTLLQVFEGVPQFRIARSELGSLPFVELAAEKTQVFPSKGECRKMVQGGGVSLNKEKVADTMRPVADADLIAGKYLLVQRGKKNYYLVIAE